jgi:[ribosomal protein S18]-alanine N-acetyltransferase
MSRADRTEEEIRIGQALAADREWAARVMASTDPWKTLGRGLDHCRVTCSERPEYELWIARSAGIPAGFILLHPRGVSGSPYIASVAVDESFRGRGVGGRLLAFAEEHFRPTARHIFLCVSSFNGRARALYERSGYALVGEFKDYVIPGASELLMHKRLDRP